MATTNWQWKLSKGQLYDSEISVYQNGSRIANYQIDCDLSEYQNKEEFTPSIDKVITTKKPTGLLIVTCVVGAHSVRINIYDPLSNIKESIFSKTGSYVAYWEMESGALWITYDQVCVTSKSKQCDARFEQIRVPWK